ncbi:hypothetical protein ABZ567_28545 [Streptomyces sp. NPDC016459]|uniref:hypothetical protein n=1 Tax=Streptomyces sp. NPDC016459 TaxID=3157190 RepID=UPI0033E8DE5F
MLTGWRRGVLWAVATAAGLVVVGLTLLLWLKDLGTAGTVAGFVADTAAVIMVVLAVRALLLQPGQQPNHTTASGPGAVAAGHNIGRAVTGDGNQMSGPAPAVTAGGSAPGGAVEASGSKAVAAGDSIGEAVTGDNNR